MIDKQLEVKESTITNAGKGLYTNVDIKRGELICEFTGKFISNEEVETLLNDNKLLYLIYWDDDVTLDVENSDCLAKYANDAEGFMKINGLKNNSKIVFEDNRCFIMATKNIKKGQEIFVSYGKEYWDNI